MRTSWTALSDCVCHTERCIHSLQDAIELFKSCSTLIDLPSISTEQHLESEKSEELVTKQTKTTFIATKMYLNAPLTEQSRVSPLFTMFKSPF